MLTRIRWRFIGASMLAFFLVISLIAGLVNIVNYVVVTGRLDNTVDTIVAYEITGSRNMRMDRLPKEPFRGLPDEDANYMTRFFIVAVDSKDLIVATSMEYVASITESEAVAYTNEALSQDSSRGYVDGYRYSKLKYDDTTVIVFLNSSREVQYMNTLLYLTLAVSGGSLILVFILVLLLSGKVIKPMEQNIELQKRFITDASHELKTPLTSISTSLDVLEMEHGSDEWTDNIRSQVGRMTGLVGEMVTLSRLDEVKPAQVKENIDLSCALWEIIEVYMPQAKAMSKDIKTDIEDNVTVSGDKNSIQQMLSVLIDNAVKYSDGRDPVTITLKKNRNKAKLLIYNSCNYDKVPDTDRLFDRFYRPDESRNQSTGGNGIGLAIAKSVAESHGGRISAFCPDGKSMTITVEI